MEYCIVHFVNLKIEKPKYKRNQFLSSLSKLSSEIKREYKLDSMPVEFKLNIAAVARKRNQFPLFFRNTRGKRKIINLKKQQLWFY